MGIIKLKRGNNENFGAITLEAGEPAFVLDTGKLYIGNGTNKVLINPEQSNAETATKLQTARNISLGGDVSGSTSFDGSTNVNINASLTNSGVVPGTYAKVTVDAKGRVTSGTNMTVADIPVLTLSKISDAGTAASKNTGTSSGNVPILDANGKLDSNVMPAIAISDTFVVSTQVAMLSLIAEIGDICVRTDLSKSYILKASPASTLANWQELLTPTSPVASVAGKTGSVVLTPSDVGLSNVTNESKATMLTNTVLTGTPIAPTVAITANNTQIATTAFVKTQGYITGDSVVDGGTF